MSWRICDIVQVLNEDCQTVADDIKNPSNRVDRSADGKFHAFWRGQVVYQSGGIKEFETERVPGNISLAAMQPVEFWSE